MYDYDYLIDYHPYHDGKNPLFFESKDSQLILDFKNKNPDYENRRAAAVAYFVDLINQSFDSKWNDCYCVAVPSSDPANNYLTKQIPSDEKVLRPMQVRRYNTLLSPLQALAQTESDDSSKVSSIYELIQRLVEDHKSLHNGSAVLVRTKNVVKKARGGNRDLPTNLNSIAINSNCGINIYGKNILLIDDIITTGNSIAACKMILKMAGASKVFVLCLGKTSRDPDVSTDTSAEVPFDEEVPF